MTTTKPQALNRLSGMERSEAVAAAFRAVIETGTDLARVTYREIGTETRIYQIVGLGWNRSYSGTQEALIVREPGKPPFVLDLIPYTRLVRLEPAEES